MLSKQMSEFLTSYPRRMSVVKGLQDLIRHEEIELDQLYIAVRMKKDDIIRTLASEGFKRVKLENKMASQIGSGFAKTLSKPWEMHVRLIDVHQQGLIALKGEVEISRRYIQHLTSVRCPVIYELESILKKHSIEYRIWNTKVRDYISQIIDNHQIKLLAPRLPAMPWKAMAFLCLTLAICTTFKYLGIWK
ncbi:MAG TPA: hypothetical protein VFH04_02750 [Nitrososphaeraceae archaeon]|nr:hypothetical protein [Nitrososphaeraceae archaeon]